MKLLTAFDIIIFSVFMTSSYHVLANDKNELFDSRFIFSSNKNKVEDKSRISRYLESDGMLPGKYNVKFYINESYVGQEIIEIKEGKETSILCKNSNIFFTNKLTLIPELEIMTGVYDCGLIEKKLNARWELDPQTLSLAYIIPDKYIDNNQKSLQERVRETQVNGILFNYNLNYNDYSEYDGEISGNLSTQANLGSVRFYADSYYSQDNYGDGDNFDLSQMYIATPLYDIESELKIGDTYTIGSTLTSGFPIRGFSISSDYDMWSESRKRFIVPITGTVNENSTIKFYYNDTLLATRHVEAGQYSFNDISPPGSGELKVIEEGQSGKKNVKIISIPSRSALLPIGAIDFNVSLGDYKESDNHIDDSVAFFSLGYGLGYVTPTLTSIVAEDYYSNEISVATIDPFGGDIEFNFSQNSYEYSYNNLAYATKYSNNINDWLSFNVNYYKYLDHDYMTFTEYQSFKNSDSQFVGYYDSRLFLSLNFQLGHHYLNSVNISYNSNDTLESFSSSDFDADYVTTENYNISFYGTLDFHNITYTLTASANKAMDSNDYEPSMFLSFDIPLNIENEYTSINSLSTYINRNEDKNYTSSASINGIINNNINYSVATQTDWESNHTDATLMLQGRNNYNQFYGSLSENNLYLQAGGSLGYSSPSGIVLSSSTGSNPTLVKLGNLEGIEQFGSKTNANGYLLTSSSPYNEKELALDVSSLSGDILVASSRENFTQGKGTFSMVNFSAEKTINYYMTIHNNGSLLEPGTLVKTSNGFSGYVNVDNTVLISERLNGEIQPVIKLSLNNSKECLIKLADKNIVNKLVSSSKVYNLGDVNCE